MAVLSLVSAFSVLAYGEVGFYALLKNPKETLNRVFFALAITFSLAALGNFLFFHAKTTHEAWFAYYPFSFAWFLFPPLFLHFFLLLTGRIKRSFPKVLPLYLPGLVLYLVSLAGPYIIADFAPGPYGWKVVYNRASLWYYLNIVHYSALPLVSLLLLIRWWKRSGSPRERKQAQVIFSSFLLSFVAGTVISTLLPLFSVGELPPLGTVLVAFWVCGIGYAVGKYELLVLTPEIAASELISKVDDLVFLLNRGGVILKANATAEKLLGFPNSRLEGKNVLRLLGRETELSELLGASFDGGLESAAGEVLPFRLSVAPIHDPAGERIGYLLTGKDQRLTRALKDSEEKFQKAFYQSPLGMALTLMPGGEYLDANEVYLELFGLERERIIGSVAEARYFWEKFSEEKETVLRAVSEKRSLRNLECRLADEDGRARSLLLSLEFLNLAGRECLLVTVLDITEKLELEKELLRIKKYESLAVFAGGIAHDFNNLLMIILGSLSLGKLYTPPDNQQLAEAMIDAEKACFRARDLTFRLLSIARGTVAKKKPVNVAKVLRDVVSLADSEKLYVTEYILPAETVFALSDELQLGQVLGNLAMNAFQAMRKGGKLSIGLGKEVFRLGDPLPAGESPLPLKPGSYCVVTFTDEGSGIPHEALQNIFDPYFTTKAKGTGLGLSVVYSILKSDGGSIYVQSTPGRGSVFTVYLPSTEDSYEEPGHAKS